MSEEETSDGHLLTAEYKDGQLEIVEVSSYKDDKQIEVPTSSEGGEGEYHILGSNKNVVVNLLNFALVRSEDGEQTYRLITNNEEVSESEGTVSCVLSDKDGDEQDQESESEYVMVEGEDGPLVLVHSPATPTPATPPSPKPRKPPTSMSPSEILERAKAVQKAKALMASQSRKIRMKPAPKKARTGGLPPPEEMLASPNFKLFLYNCKLCSFKCNAIRELTAHKALEHAGQSAAAGARRGGSARAHPAALQCARCPYRATTHPQLVKHVHDSHLTQIEGGSNPLKYGAPVYLDSAEVEAADVLVCGACGFESASRDEFKRHIEDEHGATTC